MSQVDHAYCELLFPLVNQALEPNSQPRRDRTGTGTYSIFAPRPLRLDISSEFPLLTLKKIPYRHVVEELLWFLSGSTNVKALQAKGVTIWDEWAREGGSLGRIYGAQWRDFGGGTTAGSDQISQLLYEARQNPLSRRLFISAWNAADIHGITADTFAQCNYSAPDPTPALPPCHVSFQLYLEPNYDPNQRRISMHVYMRSCDIFLGLPFNIASYATLTHLMGHVLGYKPHVLTFSFGDLHLYSNHVAQARELLARLPQERSAPTLSVVEAEVIRQGVVPAKIFEYGDDRLYGWQYGNFQLTGYDHHSAIPAEVAV